MNKEQELMSEMVYCIVAGGESNVKRMYDIDEEECQSSHGMSTEEVEAFVMTNFTDANNISNLVEKHITHLCEKWAS